MAPLIIVAFLWTVNSVLTTKGTAQSFSLMTVSSGDDQSSLSDYLNRYAFLTCMQIDQINIIDFEKLKAQSQGWVRPVHFYLPKNEDKKLKFRISQTSRAQIYYFSDHQLDKNCQELTQELKISQYYSLAKISPLIGREKSYSRKIFNDQKLIYQYEPEMPHYLFVEDIAFISRHLIELGQSSHILMQPLQQSLIPVCEEIYLNVITSLFYPEMMPVVLPESKKSESRNQTDKEINQKSNCLNSLIGSIGYLPNRYISNPKLFGHWSNPYANQIMEIKVKEVHKKMLTL